MLKWLAIQFEAKRARLQRRLETSLGERHQWQLISDTEQCRKKGNEFLRNGNLTGAEGCYRNGIQVDPTDAACHSNLGYVLVQLGRWEDARSILGKAVEINPLDFDAYYLLGNLARDRREWLRAVACYRASLTINPDFAFCRRDLCVALAQSGKIKEAQAVMEQGPAFDKNTAAYHFFKGNLHLVTDQLEDAIACFKIARELSPQDPLILLNLCATQIKRSDFFAALDTGRSILSFAPDSAQAYDHMAIALQFTGRHGLSIESYRSALRLNPEHLPTHQNLLLSLTYLQGYLPSDYLMEAQQFAVKMSARAKPFSSWLCDNYLPRKRLLRVGFVSGDLNFHPVGMFLENVLPHLDPDKISCIAYSNCPTEDPFTFHLKSMFDEWNQVAWMGDEELANKIHGDKVDILVDLAGHTGQNRLSVFAWRSAPLQLAWLGYWASTGVNEIDYLLVDSVSVHADERMFYSEQLWFLPDTRFCFSAPVTLSPIEVSDLPALRKGHVTFASFQTLSKLTDATLSMWSQVLAKLPTARLRVQSRALSYDESVLALQSRMARARIDLSRVDFFGGTSRDGYLAAYHEVDVVLDTFPFPGGTTTAEALWMGVPTVTLTSSTLLGRQGESMLCAVGLRDWVVNTEEEYVRRTMEKVANLDRLAKLRADLRVTALASPLFDGPRFAKNLEDAFESMRLDLIGKQADRRSSNMGAASS